MEKSNNIALISEGFGHGFISLLIAKSQNLNPVAFSTKETKEEFNKEVEQIYRNLVFFHPILRKATWEEREELLSTGWNIRQSLLDGKIPSDLWNDVADSKLVPGFANELPAFNGLSTETNNLMFVPQKLVSDGKCGVSAQQQSLSPELFEFLKDSAHQLVLGQHFHKVNDREKVEDLAREFSLYVPGQTEDEEVFGIRGVQHKMYWNLYSRLNGCIGIAGTHTWYLLTCRPEVPQIILFNKQGVEHWTEIEAAYQAAGYPIFCFGFDENTDLSQLFKQVEETYNTFFLR